MKVTKFALFAVAATLVTGTVGFAVLADEEELTEKAVKMGDLPKAVADTMKKELGDNKAEEIEAIAYEGVVVLYEAEYMKDGKEVEIVIRPWGELVPVKQQADDDEGEDDDDEMEDRAQQAAGEVDDDDSVKEREIEMGKLPTKVANAFKKNLGEDGIEEIEEVSYEGIVILYEAEGAKGEMAVFPNGTVAQKLQKDDDDDHEGDDDDDDRV